MDARADWVCGPEKALHQQRLTDASEVTPDATPDLREGAEMNEAQRKTLDDLEGWEVQSGDTPYIRGGWIFPDGRFVEDTKQEPSDSIVSVPEGTIIVGSKT